MTSCHMINIAASEELAASISSVIPLFWTTMQLETTGCSESSVRICRHKRPSARLWEAQIQRTLQLGVLVCLFLKNIFNIFMPRS